MFISAALDKCSKDGYPYSIIITISIVSIIWINYLVGDVQIFLIIFDVIKQYLT